MDCYFKEFLDKLNKDKRLNEYDGRSYEDRRKIYMHGREYEERKLTIIYSIDIGDIFYHTIAFSIIYIVEINLWKVEVHYSDTPTVFNCLDYNKIAEIIIEAIVKKSEIKNKKIAV